MNYTECIENARPRLGKYCKACPECNGRACKNQMPGPGSKGIGDTAVRNYDKWKQIRVNMDTIAENKPVDTSLSLFGRTFKYPVFAGPVGAVQLHYGDCLNDVTYNDILVSACAKNGIAAFTGDGTDPNVMVAATNAIKNADGAGIPTVKPWNIETIREKSQCLLSSLPPLLHHSPRKHGSPSPEKRLFRHPQSLQYALPMNRFRQLPP